MAISLPAGLRAPPILRRGKILIEGDSPPALRSMLRLSLLIAAALLLTLGLAATVIQVRGAVVASGEVDVESKVKKIAHPTGGVVAQILVHDGDHVKRGALLMRLDSKVSDASASITGKSVDQLRAQRARLVAERDGTAALAYPPELTGAHSPSAIAAMAEERRMFLLRRTTVQGQEAQLDERINQLQQQIQGYTVQIDAAKQEQVLVKPELDGLRSLYAKQLVPISRLNALERTAVELSAQEGSLTSQIATARAQIAEMRERRLQLVQDQRTAAGTELAQVDERLAEGEVRAVTSADTSDRSAIRAPYDGVIDQLAFTTIGGVVPPGETILRIVPDKEALTIEAKVRPTDIDQLAVGRAVRLRFSAFSAPTTPTLHGTLKRISAERVSDPRTGMAFYTATIAVDAGETRRLGDLVLVPGMPVEAMIQTGRRSLLSYILKPFRDQLARAFREG